MTELKSFLGLKKILSDTYCRRIFRLSWSCYIVYLEKRPNGNGLKNKIILLKDSKVVAAVKEIDTEGKIKLEVI